MKLFLLHFIRLFLLLPCLDSVCSLDPQSIIIENGTIIFKFPLNSIQVQKEGVAASAPVTPMPTTPTTTVTTTTTTTTTSTTPSTTTTEEPSSDEIITDPPPTPAQAPVQTPPQLLNQAPPPQISGQGQSQSGQEFLPGTADNVVSILYGLAAQDSRPLIQGSTNFIPEGNLREGVQALLQGLNPLIQNILFGPSPPAQYQTHHLLPPLNQNQSIQNSGAASNSTTDSSSAADVIVSDQNATSASQSNTGTQLKGEVEGSSTAKPKEYIYLVLKPDEYDEYVKSEAKSTTPRAQESNQGRSTTRRANLNANQEIEDDEYESFVLNNVTDLHLRDFYVNLTKVKE